ncbi:N-formylglutamate amidohydrolase [Woodsholea maritima]|uniref:N-formylglutamate amidohydrolase n=1 Tax=Woodsholea maritima TaxID=240237 RepID=UPI0003694755|nr:N-formylglutamate amidohydrolase [Woodsholea maritima]
MGHTRVYECPQQVYRLTPPKERTNNFVFASPHSGAQYSQAFLKLSQVPRQMLRRSEDAFVQDLFGDAPDLGASLLQALFARAYVDVNRSEGEWDPHLFQNMPGPDTGIELDLTTRTQQGLGVMARLGAEGRSLYARRLSMSEGLFRITHFYRPYHKALMSELERVRQDWGRVVLVDCHSMPNSSSGGYDIILGDRFGTSCRPELMSLVENKFRTLGFTTKRNSPYAGGFTTAHYGCPEAGIDALQIEINRGLYMSEVSVTPSSRFENVKKSLRVFMEDLTLASDACNKAAE